MASKTSPWLHRHEDSHMSWTPLGKTGNCDNTYALVPCLACHFDVPDKAKRIRFVKGKHPEALSLSDDFGSWWISGHKDIVLDYGIAMTDAFNAWFGPNDGWVWVEWE